MQIQRAKVTGRSGGFDCDQGELRDPQRSVEGWNWSWPEQEPISACWDPAASSRRGSPCSFPPSATLHTGRGGLGHSCRRANHEWCWRGRRDAVTPEQEAAAQNPSVQVAGSCLVYFCFPRVFSLYSRLSLSRALWLSRQTSWHTGRNRLQHRSADALQKLPNLRESGAHYVRLDSPKVWQMTPNLCSQFCQPTESFLERLRRMLILLWLMRHQMVE